jgi:cytosine permease
MSADPYATKTDALPDYLQAARPNPPSNRAAWYLNTAPTYAGVFLWFAFWDSVSSQGLQAGGLLAALLGIVVAAVICHFLFYLVPGLFGMKTGLPLYVVGSSTFGAAGSLIIPGFLMGLLQFGWLAVNTYFSSRALVDGDQEPGFYIACVIWASLAAFVGLKGIQYVAKVATFLPIIPLAVLVLALVKFGGSAGEFKGPAGPLNFNTVIGPLLLMVTYIVGFFATAGAAGVDFGMNNRNARDVQLGGLVGILLAIVFTAGASTIAVAGAHAQGHLPNNETRALRDAEVKKNVPMEKVEKDTYVKEYTLTEGLKDVLDKNFYRIMMIGLTLAAFPGACFSSFIAANSFKTVMPRANPFLTVGLGALVSIVLAVTRVAADLGSVFALIGASFGPICGAMFADYFLMSRKWSGPRAGFNPAGWIAWAVGFVVGMLPLLHGFHESLPEMPVPAASVTAFVVGGLLYYVLTSLGVASRILPYAPAAEQQAG